MPSQQSAANYGSHFDRSLNGKFLQAPHETMWLNQKVYFDGYKTIIFGHKGEKVLKTTHFVRLRIRKWEILKCNIPSSVYVFLMGTAFKN